jgi:hypothetical protein
MELTPEELTEIDRQARAYGFEIGRGQPLAEQVNASDDNPFLDKNWRQSVIYEPDLDVTLPSLTKPERKITVRTGGCPNDTNGDGDCGQPACPNCGKYRKAQDISDTPAPQRHTSTY